MLHGRLNLFALTKYAASCGDWLLGVGTILDGVLVEACEWKALAFAPGEAMVNVKTCEGRLTYPMQDFVCCTMGRSYTVHFQGTQCTLQRFDGD